MALEQGMIIADVEEATANTQRVMRIVNEFSETVAGFVADTKELENLGKNVSKVRDVTTEISKLMEEATAIAEQATVQMKQFAEDVSAITNVEIEL